jgi:hypothetical protein
MKGQCLYSMQFLYMRHFNFILSAFICTVIQSTLEPKVQHLYLVNFIIYLSLNIIFYY